MVRTVHMNIIYKIDLQNTYPKLDFWVSILKIYLVEYVHMDRTGHLGFR